VQDYLKVAEYLGHDIRIYYELEKQCPEGYEVTISLFQTQLAYIDRPEWGDAESICVGNIDGYYGWSNEYHGCSYEGLTNPKKIAQRIWEDVVLWQDGCQHIYDNYCDKCGLAREED
jgi:hypothetical protein